MAQLTGKTIIITGSSRGVGADTAQILAAEGANIVVNYRSKAPRANKIVKAIEEAGGKAVAVQADVTKAEDLQTLVNTAIDTFGPATRRTSSARLRPWTSTSPSQSPSAPAKTP